MKCKVILLLYDSLPPWWNDLVKGCHSHEDCLQFFSFHSITVGKENVIWLLPHQGAIHNDDRINIFPDAALIKDVRFACLLACFRNSVRHSVATGWLKVANTTRVKCLKPHLEWLNQRVISWWSGCTCSHLTDSAQIWPLPDIFANMPWHSEHPSIAGHVLDYLLNCGDSHVILTTLQTLDETVLAPKGSSKKTNGNSQTNKLDGSLVFPGY